MHRVFLRAAAATCLVLVSIFLSCGCQAESATIASEQQPRPAQKPQPDLSTTPSLPLSLEQELAAEPAAELAAAARAAGDPRNGARLFHLPQLACTRCHVAGADEHPLGPDLSRLPDDVTAEHLVESVLKPSKSIRRGYEATVLVLDDGTALTGFLVDESAEAITVRDVGQNGRLRTFPLAKIEEREVSAVSVMPVGQVNLLGGRQSFLDLVAYLIEIAENGPERALALRPAGARLGPPPAAPDTSGPQPQVYRTFMPESGPAALAVGLGRGIWLCFDPQRGGINYAWTGSLDLSPTVAQKINQPAAIEGRLFFSNATPGPLRVGRRDRVPQVEFRGYRFVDGGVTLRYQVDDVAVSEHLTALPEEDGFLRRFEFSGPATSLWLLAGSPAEGSAAKGSQPETEITVEPAAREEQAWRLDIGESTSALMRVRFVKETP